MYLYEIYIEIANNQVFNYCVRLIWIFSAAVYVSSSLVLVLYLLLIIYILRLSCLHIAKITSGNVPRDNVRVIFNAYTYIHYHGFGQCLCEALI